MIETIDFSRLKRENFKDFPMPMDFKKDEFMIVYDSAPDEYIFLKFLEVDPHAPSSLLFIDLEKSQRCCWTNLVYTGSYRWCRFDKLPIKEVFDSSNFINNRFEILDL